MNTTGHFSNLSVSGICPELGVTIVGVFHFYDAELFSEMVSFIVSNISKSSWTLTKHTDNSPLYVGSISILFENDTQYMGFRSLVVRKNKLIQLDESVSVFAINAMYTLNEGLTKVYNNDTNPLVKSLVNWFANKAKGFVTPKPMGSRITENINNTIE